MTTKYFFYFTRLLNAFLFYTFVKSFIYVLKNESNDENDEFEQESMGFKEIITILDKMKRCPMFDDDSQDRLSTITKKIEDFQLKNRKQSSIKAYFSQACNIFLVRSLSKNTYVSKYLFTLLFSLLFTIFVKNSIKNLCWSKLCPKLNFRQNLYKADISIKRTIFFAPMVSALEGFHCIMT